jgi:hypothetical protein
LVRVAPLCGGYQPPPPCRPSWARPKGPASTRLIAAGRRIQSNGPASRSAGSNDPDRPSDGNPSRISASPRPPLSLSRCPWRLGSEQGSPPPAGAPPVTGNAAPRRRASPHLPLLSFSLCPQLRKNRRQLRAEMAPSPVHSPVRTFSLRVSAPPSNGLAAVPFSGGPVSGGRQ